MVQINQIAIPTTAKATNDFGVNQIGLPFKVDFEFILPEANGIHWSTGDASRVADSLYKDDWVSCYTPKLHYFQKVRLEDDSNVGLVYGDGTDELVLNFYKIDGTLVSAQPMNIGTDNWTSLQWNWQALGYEPDDIAYLQIVGSTSGVRATSECICFGDEDCLVKLSYRNKFDNNRFGLFTSNTFRHIAYVEAEVKPTSSEDVTDYIDSAGDLTNTSTTIAQNLELTTDNIPHYMASILKYVFAHSDVLMNGVAVNRSGVSESDTTDPTDLMKLSQTFRIVGQTVQFNF